MNQSQEQTIYINFIAEINDKTSSLLMFLLTEQLRAGVKNFRINISSGGGMVFHAVSIYNFLSGLKNVTIHTHNLGQIDSGANLIFVAGHKRTASKASTFLLHPPQLTLQSQGPANFSIDFLQERLESLKKDEDKMAEIIADKISKKKSDVLKMFKERKTYTSSDAKKHGLIMEVDDFVAEPGLPIYMITNQA